MSLYSSCNRVISILHRIIIIYVYTIFYRHISFSFAYTYIHIFSATRKFFSDKVLLIWKSFMSFIGENGMEFNLFTATPHIKQSLGVICTDILSRV